MKFITCSLTSLILVAITGFTPAPASAETLHSALTNALDRNVALKRAKANVEAQAAALEASKGGWRPTISATASLESTSVSVNSKSITSSVGVSLSQLVYDGGRVSSAISVAEANHLAVVYDAKSAHQSALSLAINAYINLHYAEQSMQLYEFWLKQQQKLVGDSYNLTKFGQGTQASVAEAEAELFRILALSEQNSSTLADAQEDYRRYIGEVPENIAPPKSSIPALSDVPTSLDKVAEQTAQNNYLIKAAQARFAAAQSALKQSQAAFFPTVNLTASSNWTELPIGANARNLNHNVKLNFSMPLYAGGKITAQESQARANALAAEESLRDVKDAQQREGASSWNALQSALAQQRFSAARVKAATIAENGMSESYNQGERSLSDFLLANRKKREAELASVAANRDVLRSATRLLVATGQLGVDKFAETKAVSLQ